MRRGGRAPSRSGGATAQPADRSGTVGGIGLLIRRRQRSFALAGGATHWGRLVRPGKVTESGRSCRWRFLRRNTAGSIRRGSFAGLLCGLVPRNGSSDPLAANGWEFHEPCVGLAHQWRHHAPLGGSTEMRGSPGRSCRRVPSIDGPSNTQMEPSRPTVLCDPVTAARGSFATLGPETTLEKGVTSACRAGTTSRPSSAHALHRRRVETLLHGGWRRRRCGRDARGS